MAYLQTELHKIHLRLQALENNKAIPAHLEPDADIVPASAVRVPQPDHGTTVQYQEKTAAQAALDTKDYGAPIIVPVAVTPGASAPAISATFTNPAVPITPVPAPITHPVPVPAVPKVGA